MAESPQLPPEDEVRARWGAFAWTEENAKKAKEIVARYPAGRAQSASLPLLDLAQRQVGAETKTQGWLPVPVIEFVAREIGVPYMRVFEVVTSYTMFNMVPVGRYHVQRSEEHTPELPSLMRISYAVFCLKKKKNLYPY